MPAIAALSPEAPIAYVVSRFPKVTETFILREIVELEQAGCRIELFSLRREPQSVAHPEADQLRADPRFGWPTTASLLVDQLYWARKAHRRYVRAWRRALLGNLRSPRSLLRALAVVPVAASFARTMLELGVQHVHAHWATHPALAALVIRELTGLPYSVTLHAHDLYVDRTMLGEKLADARAVVTISEYNLDLLRSLYGAAVADKTAVIRSGVDVNVFARHTGRPRSADDRFRVLCVASLQDYKGHTYLLEACAQLVSQGVPLACTLVGEGPERPALDQMVSRLGLEGCVFLAGARSSAEVRELLAQADVMALPSVVLSSGLQEGLPVALIEAMAMEVPVVATRVSGVPELVEDGSTGLLVPERDADSLAEAIASLFESPELRRQLARAGRAKVLADHDLQVNVKRLRDLLVPVPLPKGGSSS